MLGHCSETNTCTGATGCTLTHTLVEDDDGRFSEDIIYDCFGIVLPLGLCNLNATTRRRACCSDADLCNLALMVEPFLQVSTKIPEMTTESATPPVISTGRQVVSGYSYKCIVQSLLYR